MSPKLEEGTFTYALLLARVNLRKIPPNMVINDDSYYHRFKNDQSGDLLRKFDALSGINSSLISKLSKDYRQEVSGKSI